jgi:protein-S-isoprenylcysteine O-methyltransferase Ste14
VSKMLRPWAKFLVGIVLFAGLPILGWGVLDVRGFLGNPARFAYVILVILLQAQIVTMDPGVGRDSGAGKQIVPRQRVAVFLLQVLSLAVVLAAPYSDRWALLTLDELAFLRYLGIILFAGGFILMNWAEATLGKQFSIQVTVQEDHRLVTDGLFRYLRHPRYLGIILFNVGIALVFRSGLALIIAALLVAVLLWRIQDEEKLMHQTFGEKWEAYARRSWRLLPFIY